MASRFTGPIRLEHLDADWRKWRLLEPLIWEADFLGSRREIVVPKDFVTDGASVPRPLWGLLPMTGRYLRAAALHDRLCALVTAGTPHLHAPSRASADRQFLLAMQACGVSVPVRWVMYVAVRAFAIVAGWK